MGSLAVHRMGSAGAQCRANSGHHAANNEAGDESSRNNAATRCIEKPHLIDLQRSLGWAVASHGPLLALRNSR